MGHRELPRSGRGCFGAVVAVPLAVIGLAGVLALVFLRGEQPGEQAIGKPIQGTSRPTLVSAHRPQAVVPTSSGALVREVPEEEPRIEAREAVRSGSASAAAKAPVAVPSIKPSAAEERSKRGGEPRTHRHRPSSSAPLPPSTTVVPPTSSPDSTPPPDPTVDPVPTGSSETVAPDPTPPPSPVPPLPEPSETPVSTPESAPALP